MASSPTQSPLIRDSVHERIRTAILSCELKPGSQLQERDLAEQYAVSKSPIRDALLRLESQQLIEVMPRKGYRVRPISLADARELYEMRAILERACIERTIETASDQRLASLDAFRRVPKRIELAQWVSYNRDFHLAITDACGNARLASAARDVLEQFDRLTFMSVTVSQSGSLARFVEEHGSIIDAMQKRDKRAATKLMRDHVDASRKRLLDHVASLAIVP